MKSVSGLFSAAQRQVQVLVMALIAGAASGLVLATTAAFIGALPWVEIYASFGGTQVAEAGKYLQIALTVLFVLLAFYLPANHRIMQLETSHRDFAVSMDDVARAYRASHEADRKKLFKIGGEFDSVRERMRHLRDHPDLGALEPDILDLAAQMSHTSRDLASVYSEATVDRARVFLRQRQQEVDSFLENIAMAKKTTQDLRHWMQQIETEEGVAAKQMSVLEADLMALLPELGFEVDDKIDMADQIVVPMPQKPRPPVTPRRPSKPMA
ncbi:MAG: DNA repair protein [Pseudomonadota bacterium]|nr:DNA repair protein [Pseudomonadota bacterium]